MDDLAHDAFFDELAGLVIGVIGHVLGTDLYDALVLLGFLAKLPGEVHLRPVRKRFFAVHVLARVQASMACGAWCRSGVAMHTMSTRGSAEFLVKAVDLAAGLLGRGAGPRGVHVAYRHGIAQAAGLEVEHGPIWAWPVRPRR